MVYISSTHPRLLIRAVVVSHAHSLAYRHFCADIRADKRLSKRTCMYRWAKKSL